MSQTITLSSDDEVAGKETVERELTDAELWERLEAKKRLPQRAVLQSGDLSSGQEARRVPVFNEATRQPMDPHFKYGLRSKRRPAFVRPEAACECAGSCDGATCRCWRDSAVKLLDGRIADLQAVLERPLERVLLECRDACACRGRCGNAFTTDGLPFRAEIDFDEQKGYGVRTRDYVPRGAFFCEFVGEMLAPHERANIVYQYAVRDAKAGRPAAVIDAKAFSNVSRFINHSCAPSLSPFAFVRAPDSSRAYPQIGFLAVRDIAAGEEVTIHYGEAYWKAADYPCLCGSARCIKPPQKLRPEERARAEAAERRVNARSSELVDEYAQCLRRMEQLKAGNTFEEVLAAEVVSSAGSSRPKPPPAAPVDCEEPPRPQSPLVVTAPICIDDD
ncbi:hypothetical protein M3Y99_00938400 [Aphelenchoides fujianensis]|nr:hypothetical protein M3Y99_00938400 [Aphelenchoides fujianensis]